MITKKELEVLEKVMYEKGKVYNLMFSEITIDRTELIKVLDDWRKAKQDYKEARYDYYKTEGML
jgi:hypothetical protein